MTNLIQLRGVRVHNLQSIDLDLPRNSLIGFCGPSGSGKSSLAINTLFYEGQRRYLETFSVAGRNLIEQPEKPEADEILGLPPAIAIARSNERLNPRSTVGTATEILYYLQLIFSRFGESWCQNCQRPVQSASVFKILQEINALPKGCRLMVGFDRQIETTPERTVRDLQQSGFRRFWIGDQIQRSDDPDFQIPEGMNRIRVVVDRLSIDPERQSRLAESIEAAFQAGDQSCFLLVESVDTANEGSAVVVVDGKTMRYAAYSSAPACDGCGQVYPRLSPTELSFNSPQAACDKCEGLGKVDFFPEERIVTEPRQSISTGAIHCFDATALKAQKNALEKQFSEILNVPFYRLEKSHQQKIIGHCRNALEDLAEGTTRKSIVSTLARYRSEQQCPECSGGRLNPIALSLRWNTCSMADFTRRSIDELRLTAEQEQEVSPAAARLLWAEIGSRLDYLNKVGVGYLSLDRDLNSLSSGERQRVAMTNALGSQLVNMLYVLDEPCSGLHPTDVPPLIQSIRKLAQRGNTVVAVDHDLDLMLASDQVAEFGPGAGIYGGKLNYFGHPKNLVDAPSSLTGDYLAGRRGFFSDQPRRPVKKGFITLNGASGHNLKDLGVEFPLGLLCVVTGVSGSGKSSLVVDTLYPAICIRLGKPAATPLPYEDVRGIGAIDDVLLVDQAPLGANSRSNPATYTKCFDAIRHVFAETLDARTRNFKPGQFSFNSDGGRCDACKGEGYKEIDMQFLSNLEVKCKYCKGRRYQREILNVKYRDRNIADVLDMTVREAFSFFRGQKKVQMKMKPLMDVGLDYLRLGQPASTLSAGESQRLRLAGFLSSGKKSRTLFVLDEPTIGLHYSDVVKLLDCFDALVSEGHSLIVVEHNKMMMAAADYLIDLGPGPASEGGKVVVKGTPETVSNCQESRTGEVLRAIIQQQANRRQQ